MTGFGVLLKKELKEHLRNYKLVIVAGVFILFGLSTPLMLHYLPELLRLGGEDIIIELPAFASGDVFSEYASTLTQMGVLVAVLVGMGSVAQERNRGIMAMILSKPVMLETFMVAKLVGLSIVFIASLTVAGLGCYGYTAFLFEGADALDFLALNVLLGFFFTICLAEIVLISSIFKNQLAAGGLALALLIIQALMGAIPKLGDYLPNSLVNWGVELVNNGTASAWPAVAVGVGIICGSMILSVSMLKTKEL